MTKKYQIKPKVMTTGANNFNKEYVTKVMDLPDEERPREKLLKSGPRNLSITELLAIVLGTGTRREEVMTMASRLLREYGERTIISQTSPRLMAAELKLPIAKTCQIVACFELGRRLFQKKNEGLVSLRSAKNVYDYLTDMRNLSKEQFRALYLNNRYQLIHEETISVGSSIASIVDPKEVFRPAIQYSASAIVLVHNHPSGELKASAADRELTKKLAAAGDILNIKIIDHVIIAKNKFISIF